MPATGSRRRRDVERVEVDERILAANDRVVAEALLPILLLLRLGLGGGERDAGSVGRPLEAGDVRFDVRELDRLAAVRTDREDLRLVADATAEKREPPAVGRPRNPLADFCPRVS